MSRDTYPPRFILFSLAAGRWDAGRAAVPFLPAQFVEERKQIILCIRCCSPPGPPRTGSLGQAGRGLDPDREFRFRWEDLWKEKLPGTVVLHERHVFLYCK